MEEWDVRELRSCGKGGRGDMYETKGMGCTLACFCMERNVSEQLFGTTMSEEFRFCSGHRRSAVVVIKPSPSNTRHRLFLRFRDSRTNASFTRVFSSHPSRRSKWEPGILIVSF
jgi:hypothetical protein